VPHILARGADWFRSMGTEASPGNIVCTVVGDVVAPDVGEVELGTPLGAVIDAVASGIGAGRRVKAVMPGVAAPVVTDLSVPVSYEGFEAVGSAMGAAGYIVLDDTACMVNVAHAMSRFLFVESCGQCPPCKLGSGEITTALSLIAAGDADHGEIQTIDHWLARVTDANRCYLGTQERLVVASIVETFRSEVEDHLALGRCPRPREFTLPRLADLGRGVATYEQATRTP